MGKGFKKALIPASIYGVLFLLSYLYFIMRWHEHDKFSSLFLIIVTAPWPELISLARLKFGIERELSFVAINIIMLASGLINLVAVILLTRKLNSEKEG